MLRQKQIENICLKKKKLCWQESTLLFGESNLAFVPVQQRQHAQPRGVGGTLSPTAKETPFPSSLEGTMTKP